ncbi:MAG TPA: hypothetical protein VFM06_09480 [Candidatus Limnocylindria bacterium]|nr:hypothetical protein [Candidatus Limnocylindria bacterium]
MSQARGLLPYATLALGIVAATIVALVATTLDSPVTAPEGPSASPTPSLAAAGRPFTDLSPGGRLAYWRLEANGETHLFIANADNSRRRSVAKVDRSTAISHTRWAADGSAIAYVEAGVRLVVIRIDGATAVYTLSRELRTAGHHIVDHRASPSGARVAVTVQRSTGSQSDVYLAADGALTRLTTTEDVLAVEWLTEDELLVHTTGGIVGRLRTSGRDQLRPLTGLAGGTPVVGEDGRIHFLAGRVTSFAGAAENLILISAASIWSMTADGEDLRRESVPLGPDSLRLDGLWPGGGYLLHRGTSAAQLVVTPDGPIDLPTAAGAIERLRAAPDRRSAVGFAGTNLVRLDLRGDGTVANTVVLLGSVGQGDAWFPRAPGLAKVMPPAVSVPAARYTFALGGHLWTMAADGTPALLRSGSANAQTLRRFALAPPRWSPTGDRLLTVESLGPGSNAFQLVAVTITRDGTVRRYTTPASVGPTATWSSDGSRLAVVGLPAATTDPAVLASDLAISLVDAASGIVPATVPGREAFWTSAGLAVLSNGTYRAGDRAREDQAIEIWNEGARRQVVAISALATDPRVRTDPRMQAFQEQRGIALASGLTAAPDGAYLAIRVTFLIARGAGAADPTAFAMVRARDGAATVIETGIAVSDEAWSPSGRVIGYTQRPGGPPFGAPPRAVVRDAETGDTLVDVEGRFAGWSPDGAWLYVARDEGLFARPLAGGQLVRFSPYGVVVSTTHP